METQVIDNLPLWVSIPLIIILGISALYRCYILPGYIKDKEK